MIFYESTFRNISLRARFTARLQLFPTVWFSLLFRLIGERNTTCKAELENHSFFPTSSFYSHSAGFQHHQPHLVRRPAFTNTLWWQIDIRLPADTEIVEIHMQHENSALIKNRRMGCSSQPANKRAAQTREREAEKNCNRVSLDFVHKSRRKWSSQSQGEARKSDTFISTVVSKADSIILGALLFFLVLGRSSKKKEEKKGNFAAIYLMPRLEARRRNIARKEKSKTREAYL